MSLSDWQKNGWLTPHVTSAREIAKKRNITGYERVGIVSDADAAEMRKLASHLRDDVVAWLRGHHSNLMKGR